MDDDIVEDNGGGDEYSEDENVSTNTTTSDEEGIFDVPSGVDQTDRQYYILFKGRFTVEANRDPLGRDFNEMTGEYYGQSSGDTTLSGWNTLFLRTAEELNATGQIYDIRKRETKDLIISWTQNWYNTDPGIQSKIQEALASYEGAQQAIALSGRSNVGTITNREDMRQAFMRKYREEFIPLRDAVENLPDFTDAGYTYGSAHDSAISAAQSHVRDLIRANFRQRQFRVVRKTFSQGQSTADSRDPLIRRNFEW